MGKKEMREFNYESVVKNEELNKVLIEKEKEYRKNQMMIIRATKDKERFESEYELQIKKSWEWGIISELATKDENKTLFLEGIKRKEEYRILSIKYQEEVYRQEKIINMLKMKLKELLNEIDKLKIKLNII